MGQNTVNKSDADGNSGIKSNFPSSRKGVRKCAQSRIKYNPLSVGTQQRTTTLKLNKRSRFRKVKLMASPFVKEDIHLSTKLWASKNKASKNIVGDSTSLGGNNRKYIYDQGDMAAYAYPQLMKTNVPKSMDAERNWKSLQNSVFTLKKHRNGVSSFQNTVLASKRAVENRSTTSTTNSTSSSTETAYPMNNNLKSKTNPRRLSQTIIEKFALRKELKSVIGDFIKVSMEQQLQRQQTAEINYDKTTVNSCSNTLIEPVNVDDTKVAQVKGRALFKQYVSSISSKHNAIKYLLSNSYNKNSNNEDESQTSSNCSSRVGNITSNSNGFDITERLITNNHVYDNQTHSNNNHNTIIISGKEEEHDGEGLLGSYMQRSIESNIDYRATKRLGRSNYSNYIVSKKLDLSCFSGGDELISRILEKVLASTTLLEEIDLSSNNLYPGVSRSSYGGSGYKQLAEEARRKNGNASKANGSNDIINISTTSSFSHSTNHTNKLLVVPRCIISLAGCVSTTLSVLNIANNPIGDAGYNYFINYIMKHPNINLKSLNISQTTSKEEHIIRVLNAVKRSRSIEYLNISKNHLKIAAGKTVAAFISENKIIKMLDMSWNSINGKAASLIANALLDNATLRNLNISFNGVDNDGAKDLFHSVRHNSWIFKLDLSFNRLSEKCAPSLIKLLESNKTLEILRLNGNYFKHKTIDSLLSVLMHTKHRYVKLNNNVLFSLLATNEEDQLESNTFTNNNISGSGDSIYKTLNRMKGRQIKYDIDLEDARERKIICKILKASSENISLKVTNIFHSAKCSEQQAVHLVRKKIPRRNNMSLSSCSSSVSSSLSSLSSLASEVDTVYRMCRESGGTTNSSDGSFNAKQSETQPWKVPHYGRLQFVYMNINTEFSNNEPRSITTLKGRLQQAVKKVAITKRVEAEGLFSKERAIELISSSNQRNLFRLLLGKQLHFREGTKVDITSQIIPYLLHWEDRFELVKQILNENELKLLQSMLGQLWNFCPANPTKHYLINLSHEFDRFLLKRLYKLSIQLGEKRSSNLFPDISVNGDYSCIRNSSFNDESIIIDSKFMKHLPHSGILSLDFVGIDRPSPYQPPPTPLSDDKLISILQKIGLRVITPVDNSHTNVSFARNRTHNRKRSDKVITTTSASLVLLEQLESQLSQQDTNKTTADSIDITRNNIGNNNNNNNNNNNTGNTSAVFAHDKKKEILEQLEQLRLIISTEYITSKQCVELLLKCIPMHLSVGLHCRAMQTVFSRVLDIENFRETVCNNKNMQRIEISEFIRSVGWLCVLNPLTIEGRYELDLSYYDQWVAADILVQLSHFELEEESAIHKNYWFRQQKNNNDNNTNDNNTNDNNTNSSSIITNDPLVHIDADGISHPPHDGIITIVYSKKEIELNGGKNLIARWAFVEKVLSGTDRLLGPE